MNNTTKNLIETHGDQAYHVAVQLAVICAKSKTMSGVDIFGVGTELMVLVTTTIRKKMLHQFRLEPVSEV
jgi:hypothetical protein